MHTAYILSVRLQSLQTRLWSLMTRTISSSAHLLRLLLSYRHHPPPFFKHRFGLCEGALGGCLGFLPGSSCFVHQIPQRCLSSRLCSKRRHKTQTDSDLYNGSRSRTMTPLVVASAAPHVQTSDSARLFNRLAPLSAPRFAQHVRLLRPRPKPSCI